MIYKTFYQNTENGVQAISMSDEHYKQLSGNVTFLDESSKEVQAYLTAIADAETEKLQAMGKAERELYDREQKDPQAVAAARAALDLERRENEAAALLKKMKEQENV